MLTDDAMRRRWGLALQTALDSAGMTHRRLAAALHEMEQANARNGGPPARPMPIAGQSISSWCRGDSLPADPLMVFAVERAVGVPPGHLSRHLHIWPDQALTTCSLDVLLDDRGISDERAREALRMLLDSFSSSPSASMAT
jgi:hypothetical protein